MSIKPNELRIGNWVQSPLGDFMKVEIIGHADMPDYVFAKSETGFGQNKFNPIPLTPEILEACGFMDNKTREVGKSDDIIEWGHENAEIRKEAGEYEYILSFDEWGSRQDSVTVKYLHQLQNIYFAINGEELKINL